MCTDQSWDAPREIQALNEIAHLALVSLCFPQCRVALAATQAAHRPLAGSVQFNDQYFFLLVKHELRYG